MQEKLIEYNTAVLSKEKGFDWECKNYYQDSARAGVFEIKPFIKNSLIDELHIEDKYCIIFYSVPTQSFLQRWLREFHKIHIEMSVGGDNQYGVIYGTWNNPKWFRDEQDIDVLFFQTYEEALEAGLYKSLLLIKT